MGIRMNPSNLSESIDLLRNHCNKWDVGMIMSNANWTYTPKYPNLIVVECTKCSQSWQINNPKNPDMVMYDMKLRPGDEKPTCTC